MIKFNLGEPAISMVRLGYYLRNAVYAWVGLGLTSQFVMITFLLILAITYVGGAAQKSIAEHSIVETSLDIEQALAKVTFYSAIGNEPLRGRLDPQLERNLRAAIADSLDPVTFRKVKLWGVDGSLLFDSSSSPPFDAHDVPAVQRALAGETVMAKVDEHSDERGTEFDLGSLTYEVYMPIRATDGRLLAVGEIYCSVELQMARMMEMLSRIDRARSIVAALGILVLGALVVFAHRRLNAQSAALSQSLRESEELARANSRYLAESEAMRRSASESTEVLLNHIGAELHDGPIQLMSLASLYWAQGAQAADGTANGEKARKLLQQALTELRNISSGLVLPELDGKSLQGAISAAIDSFERETGLSVARRVDEPPLEISKPKLVVAYRIIYEALNNARKHADGKDMQVELQIMSDAARIRIADAGPGLPSDQRKGGSRIQLGLQYMTYRARSVGASLAVANASAERGGTSVILSLPLMQENRPADQREPA